MKLLLIRHAAAVPRGTPGVPDAERPLTPQGKAEFRVAARGLARVTRRPDVLLTSPLPRARLTAEIAALAFEKGGAALVDLPNGPAAGGRLRWFLKPRILRSLAGPAERAAPQAGP